jgi:hypothetical protein
MIVAIIIVNIWKNRFLVLICFILQIVSFARWTALSEVKLYSLQLSTNFHILTLIW